MSQDLHGKVGGDLLEHIDDLFYEFGDITALDPAVGLGDIVSTADATSYTEKSAVDTIQGKEHLPEPIDNIEHLPDLVSAATSGYESLMFGRNHSAAGTSSKAAKVKRGPRPRLFRKHHCQADDCNANLASASFYYQRNHICTKHLKAESFLLYGVQSRFCQRCGLSHPLTEFDSKRKSCRVSLERQNQRRRQRQAAAADITTQTAIAGGIAGVASSGPTHSLATGGDGVVDISIFCEDLELDLDWLYDPNLPVKELQGRTTGGSDHVELLDHAVIHDGHRSKAGAAPAATIVADKDHIHASGDQSTMQTAPNVEQAFIENNFSENLLQNQQQLMHVNLEQRSSEQLLQAQPLLQPAVPQQQQQAPSVPLSQDIIQQQQLQQLYLQLQLQQLQQQQLQLQQQQQEAQFQPAQQRPPIQLLVLAPPQLDDPQGATTGPLAMPYQPNLLLPQLQQAGHINIQPLTLPTIRNAQQLLSSLPMQVASLPLAVASDQQQQQQQQQQRGPAAQQWVLVPASSLFQQLAEQQQQQQQAQNESQI